MLCPLHCQHSLVESHHRCLKSSSFVTKLFNLHCQTRRQIPCSSPAFFVFNVTFQFLSTLHKLWRASFAILMQLRILLQFLQSVIQLSKYLNSQTHLQCVTHIFGCPFCLSQCLVFLIITPFSLLSLTLLSYCYFSLPFESAISIVLSVQHMLIRLCLPIINPGRPSNSFRIISLYRVNKSSDKTLTCCTSLSGVLSSLSICRQVVYQQ